MELIAPSFAGQVMARLDDVRPLGATVMLAPYSFADRFGSRLGCETIAFAADYYNRLLSELSKQLTKLWVLGGVCPDRGFLGMLGAWNPLYRSAKRSMISSCRFGRSIHFNLRNDPRFRGAPIRLVSGTGYVRQFGA